MLDKFALAVDTETSGVSRGADPSLGYQMVSLGAHVVRLSDFEVVDSIYFEVKHDERYGWEAGAEAVHGLTREHLAQHGLTFDEAAHELLSFVMKWFGTGMSVIAVGHRVEFDKRFIDRLLADVGCELWWNRLTIDTAAIGAAFLDIDRSEELFQTLGLPARAEHNALTDITYTVEVLKRLKQLFKDGLNALAND